MNLTTQDNQFLRALKIDTGVPALSPAEYILALENDNVNLEEDNLTLEAVKALQASQIARLIQGQAHWHQRALRAEKACDPDGIGAEWRKRFLLAVSLACVVGDLVVAYLFVKWHQ